MTTEDNIWTTTSAPASFTTSTTTFVPPYGFREFGDENGTNGDFINNPFIQLFFYILYTTVFVLGVFGNVLVCYVVLRNRAMQTVTNIFITNLAMSDILLCILAVPFTPFYTFLGRWVFGKTLCHMVSFSQGCSIYISTMTLTAIAVDRYYVICAPFRPRTRIFTCFLTIVFIWLFSIIFTLPYGMFMKVTEVALFNGTDLFTANFTGRLMPNGSIYDPTPNRSAAAQMYIRMMTAGIPLPPEIIMTTYCEENWPSEQWRKVFGTLTTLGQFILPFSIISICYTWISVKLNARARAKPGSKSSRREEVDRERKKRTNRMLIAMVGVFGLSWLPINLVNIFDDFYEKSNEWRYYTFLFFVAHSIAMSSTCYNPFLYAWLNENFRKEFKHVLPCFNPSNNNVLNITRGYNRSDRNTCGPRLHHGNGEGGHGGGGTMDIEDQDDNGITQETCLPKEKLLIIPREPTYGNGSTGAVSPVIGGFGLNTALVHNNRQQVDILLNDRDLHRKRRQTDDETYIDSGDEQTVEVRFSETPFVSSDNATAISMVDTSTSRQSNEPELILELIPEFSKPITTGFGGNGGQQRSN